MNLAIFSPRQTASTETFIQAHRDIPGVNVNFYYGGIQQAKLEGQGALLDLSFGARIKEKLQSRFKKFGFSPVQSSIAQSFLDQGIDCILAEYGMMGVNVMPIAEALGIPLIVHFHGFDASTHSVIEELGEKYKQLFAYASSVVVVSKVMAGKIEELGCPPEKIALNTYGVNPSFLEITPSYSQKLLVGLGRFVDKKAPYLTILAFQKVLNKHPDARLVLGGNGSLLETCQNLVEEWGLTQNIDLPGLVAPADFRNYLAKARAFVQHSITPRSGDMEGTPLAVLEAQAAALPVISTIHAGIPDVVVHEETGLLCKEKDVETMAQHMIRLLDDESLARELGTAGRKRYQIHFTLERHLSELSRIVHQSVTAIS